jgi:teichuronic acid biosynthesis glycosyltransferase TuaH
VIAQHQDWDDLVIVCAGTSWDGIWFPEKHIAHRLAQYAPVLYVDPAISMMTAKRNPDLKKSLEGPRLRVVEGSLARLTPVALPGMHRPGMHLATAAITRRAIRRAVRTLGARSVRAVVVASPGPFFGVCGGRQVLYATDDFLAGASLVGMPERRLRKDQARQAARADTVVTISPALSEKWRALGHEPVMIANGCDDRLFACTDEAPPPADVHLPAPIAGFIGHLSERIDLSLLEAVAERGRSLLLVGPRQNTFEMRRVEVLLSLPNVQWVGPKPFEALPSYLGSMHVGLTPYGDTAFNRASFPLKTLEYLAGGRAAVATDLPAVRWLETDLIDVAFGPQPFADAVEKALDGPRTPVLVARRRALAARHSWASRTIDFAGALGIDIGSTLRREIEAAAP